MLEEHLDSGRADAWRPALRVLEHGWGRLPEKIESEVPLGGELDFEKMSTARLTEFVRERREERASAEVLAQAEESAGSATSARSHMPSSI